MRAALKTNPSYSVPIGTTSLYIVQGDPLAVDAEALLCYSSTSLTLHSNLAQRIVAEGGAAIRAEGAKHAPASCGSALALPAGKLPQRHLLVAVTNALRDAPTLDDLRASMGAAAAEAARLDLRSIAVPLLRAGRAMSAEETLRATLAPLIDHCCGPSPLRKIFLVLDEESELGLMARLCRYLEATLDELLDLGAWRAQIAALHEVERQLAPFTQLAPELLYQAMRAQLDMQLGLLEQLELRRAAGGRDQPAVTGELRQCEREVERLMGTLSPQQPQPLLERALGG